MKRLNNLNRRLSLVLVVRLIERQGKLIEIIPCYVSYANNLTSDIYMIEVVFLLVIYI